MHRAMRILVLPAGTALGIQGCAGAPPAPEAVAAAAVEESENPFPETTRRKGPNGDCWSELATGSRIPSQICATESTVRERAIATRQSLEDIRDPASRGDCNPTAGC